MALAKDYDYWEELEEERRVKRKMPQHGKGLAKIYKNAVSRRANGRMPNRI